MRKEWRYDGYVISTDASRLDLRTVHNVLKTSYWAAGIPFEVVERSVENSMIFGVYSGEEQVGFARVVTNRATFAYLADVFVLETHRGRGKVADEDDLLPPRPARPAALHARHERRSRVVQETRLRRAREPGGLHGEKRRLLRRLSRGRYVPRFARRRLSQELSANQPPSTE